MKKELKNLDISKIKDEIQKGYRDVLLGEYEEVEFAVIEKHGIQLKICVTKSELLDGILDCNKRR